MAFKTILSFNLPILLKEADKSPVDEPKKVNKKPAPAPKDVDDDLSAIVDNWDD